MKYPVDIDAGNAFVERLKTKAPAIGGFSLSLIHISEPTRPY